jgi:hypothetical protein
VDWRWPVPAVQAARAWPFRLAASGRRHGQSDACPVVDPARGDRLAPAGAYLASAVGLETWPLPRKLGRMPPPIWINAHVRNFVQYLANC